MVAVFSLTERPGKPGPAWAVLHIAANLHRCFSVSAVWWSRMLLRSFETFGRAVRLIGVSMHDKEYLNFIRRCHGSESS